MLPCSACVRVILSGAPVRRRSRSTSAAELAKDACLRADDEQRILRSCLPRADTTRLAGGHLARRGGEAVVADDVEHGVAEFVAGDVGGLEIRTARQDIEGLPPLAGRPPPPGRPPFGLDGP